MRRGPINRPPVLYPGGETVVRVRQRGWVISPAGSGPCQNGSNPGCYTEAAASMPWIIITSMAYVDLKMRVTVAARQMVRLQ